MSTDPSPPARPATLEDVARLAGVSRATVSRVINGSHTVDPARRLKVERAVAAASYVPNRAARSLVTRRTDSIALVVSERQQRSSAGPFAGRIFTDPHFGRVVDGLLGELRPAGVQMALMLADDADTRDQLVGYLHQGHVDGVVLISQHSDDPLPGMLARCGLPAVLASRPATSGEPIGCVEVDQRLGARLAADRLVGRGCRRIATVCGPLDMPAGSERLTGFREAMADHGAASVVAVEGGFTQAGGAAAMKRLLERVPDLDGVFIASDLMALGALPVLHRQGRRVPEDVAVVGFDDSDAAVACDPRLTTVRQPVEEMAGEMARLLLERIADPGRPARSVVFAPELVVRQSG
ncbi:LacI family DNA-binding transcriptional regulator [Streptomyces sp. SL13]|uniref:LacI family DNA-binding transcriptional regulator n=1 Tax=Streptantibioticus silvisoli TaxID=2705255 RepID=A0AA90H2B9_9ACTN|nr:LacI family DNA-binding transcriptional regulator [Streptantibioticus silvisoli]MDI5966206.1 LacI family DNA-binding transcriptional regulator [Streptantibioticus silvisoli]MDI5968957.1 LacI family DNA-binding transcriptional regulator [Streptantibioticus silvisoli]